MTYDRRGKGRSADTQPWSPAREVDDLVAVINAADLGPVAMYGFSSGGTLALYAASHGAPVERILALEPPLGPLPGIAELHQKTAALVETGDGAGAIRAFHQFQGVPEDVIEQLAPLREALAPAASTIRYDTTLTDHVTDDTLADVGVATLALASQASPPPLSEFAHRVAAHVPGAEHHLLPGDWHGIEPAALIATIRDFCLR